MKKAIRQRGPSAESLRHVPEVDFAKLRPGRRNPWVARMKAEGWQLVHEEPSAASLQEMPELPSSVHGQASPYAARIKAQGIELQIGRHRPKRGAEIGPTQVKSVRLPPAFWKQLRKEAKERGVTLHALVRMALVRWLDESHVGH